MLGIPSCAITFTSEINCDQVLHAEEKRGGEASNAREVFRKRGNVCVCACLRVCDMSGCECVCVCVSACVCE